MKSIFTRLSALLCCGVVAMVGCTDFSEDIAALEKVATDDVEALADAIADLEAELENQYATKQSVEDLQDAVSDLQEALNSKADIDDLQQAIQDVQAALDALDDTFATDAELAGVKETLEGQISDLADRVTALEGKPGCECQPSEGCTCTPSEGCTCTPYDDKEIVDAITKINGTLAQLDDYKLNLETTLGSLETRLGAIEAQIAGFALKSDISSINDQIKAINDTLAGLSNCDCDEYDDTDLQNRVSALESALENLPEAAQPYDDSELRELIAALTAQYSAITSELQGIKDRLTDLEGAVEELTNALRSVVIVPQILVNGTPAVEFKSFVYVPMTADSDDVPSVEGAADAKVIGSTSTYAYYHFNPSNFDVASATYAVVSTTVQTRSAADEPVATVGSVVKEGDKVKVELARNGGADNMFALAATLADGNVIYSDYALVLDANVTAEDLVIVDNNDVALYTTRIEAEANDAQIQLSSDMEYNFADYVKAIDPVFAAYGLEYKYSAVYGDVVVAEDGVADLSAASGVSLIAVEAVKGQDVVRRAYVKVYVDYVEVLLPGMYYYANVTASVEASRIAFEVSDIAVWLKALKDEPNTVEILKQVVDIVKNIADIQASDKTQIEKNFLIEDELKVAYQLLNGVPGFVYKYATFTGVGEGKARVSLLPEVESIGELKAVLEMIEEQYPEINVADDFAQKVEQYIPQSLKDNWLMSRILDALADFQLSDVLENETVVNLLEAGQSIANKFGVEILDYDTINAKLEEVVINAVGETNYGETAAKISAEAKARAAAKEALDVKFNEANAQLLVNFDNGVWAQVHDFLTVDLNLDNPVIAKLLEMYNLTGVLNELQNALDTISQKGKDLVKYTYESDAVVYTLNELYSFEVK